MIEQQGFSLVVSAQFVFRQVNDVLFLAGMEVICSRLLPHLLKGPGRFLQIKFDSYRGNNPWSR